MYYQNGNYMQDLNYYNQTPNMNYNPYRMNYSNQNIPMNQAQMPMTTNLNAMYPATYRIVAPVVAQVLSNHSGYLTEDSLNSMVDTVYNIVEGDINLGNQNARSVTNPTSENSNASNCERNSPTSRSSAHSTTTSGTNSQNALLKDFIKVIMLNEISSRRQNATMMMPNQNLTQPMLF